MTNNPCPTCGHQTATDATACPGCGNVLMNGALPSPAKPYRKPPPPPELTGRVFEKVPPEIIEETLGPFNLEQFLAAEREIEETGGLRFEDFVEELERAAGEHD